MVEGAWELGEFGRWNWVLGKITRGKGVRVQRGVDAMRVPATD